ncbi:glycosyltransferase family 87 protein [Fimbriiglobus ruber]|uniref:Putative membrane protein n=1 Tax=Fimbriiglobus ruber TaxID=1908690 RepID=A0A225E017_9BACT|nr:glycosyltransferase family 87 protein [Fimbriiglobus ruber]OWK45154.1 putative membrane protein [Fimbriiglobus ruber]
MVMFAIANAVLSVFPIVSQFRGIARDDQVKILYGIDPANPPDFPGQPLAKFEAKWSRGGSKDYPLWYERGGYVLDGLPLYPTKPDNPFPFLYPPFAALLLAIPSSLGPYGCVLFLVVVNILSWTACVWLASRLAAGDGPVDVTTVLVPSTLWALFVYDMFHVGQPNLMLLGLVLGGLACLRSGREIAGGALFATAAAIKAFPVVIICYLLWRRYWTAAASMLVGTVVLLVLVPAPFRGFERNLDELQLWASRMIPRTDAEGLGQRAAQAQAWKNQSLFSVGHRFLRPVDADGDAVREKLPDGTYAPHTPLYVNFLDLSPTAAGVVIMFVAAAIGLGFILIMPAYHRRTPTSDSAEWGVLITLMVLASPIAYYYYFVWLLYPVTVLVHRAVVDPARAVRRGTWAILAVSVVLFAIMIFTMEVPHYIQAYGNYLWASFLMIGGLVWHMRRTAKPVDGSVPLDSRFQPVRDYTG